MIIKLEIVLNSILLGVILTTQLVSYPLFLKVNIDNFKSYHNFYTKHISYIVVPLMLFEFFINFYNLYHSSIIYPKFYISSLVLIFIWFSTMLIQLPLHININFYFSKIVIDKLIKSNWIRTVLWSIKLVILIFIKEF